MEDFLKFANKLADISFTGRLIVEFDNGEVDAESTSVESPHLTARELRTLLAELNS